LVVGSAPGKLASLFCGRKVLEQLSVALEGRIELLVLLFELLILEVSVVLLLFAGLELLLCDFDLTLDVC
jgi:hypothetical protein